MSRQIDHASDRALKTIKIQLLKTALLTTLLMGLAYKQYDFLYHAIASHPELNLLIIAIFGLGMVLAVRSLISLFDDERALRWMKETTSDFEIIDNQSGDHGLKRLLRVTEPAKIFGFPRIVGQVFGLAMEELMQNRSFHVSLAQRSAIMGTVNEAVNREKSLVQYMTGVLILLGLIGTFIGLMEMVASVGGIVGGLARAGSGSDEAIKGVIKDLEAPLTGMATGFSASLFGLLGSLVLGLIARFAQTATFAIKHDVEQWLTRISQLEQPHHTSTNVAGQSTGGSVSSLAASLIGSFRTIQGILIRSADMMRKLAEREDQQTDAMNRLMVSLDALTVREEQALWQLRRLDAIGDSVEAMRSDGILRDKALGGRLTSEFGRIADLVDQSESRQALRFADVIEQHRVTERLARSIEVQAARGFEDLTLKSSTILTEQSEVKRLMHEAQDVMVQRLREHSKPIDVTGLADRLSAAVDERLASGFGAIAATLDKSLTQLAGSLQHFGDVQAAAINRLDGMAGDRLADEMRSLSKSIETGLSAGFADLSRVLDVIVSSQAALAAGNDIDPAKRDHGVSGQDVSEGPRPNDDTIRLNQMAAMKRALRASSNPPSDSTF